MRKYHGTEGITRALQSRIAKRGSFLAMMEDAYTEQKDIGTQLVAAGQSKKDAYMPARNIRSEIKIVSDEQKLDRDILLELYSVGLQHIENEMITKQRKRELRLKLREAALTAATTPAA